MINSDVALKRQLGVLPNLSQAVLYYVLWVTCDVTQSDLWNVSENEAAKRSKVPL
jgi:hypothetical protein